MIAQQPPIQVTRGVGLDAMAADPSCVLDLDPRYNVYTDTGGTTPATNGQTVKAIKDQKSATLLIQSDSAQCPTLVSASDWKGRPALVFSDSVSMGLENASWSLAYGASAWTWVGVFNYTSGSNSSPWGMQSDTLTPSRYAGDGDLYIYKGGGGNAHYMQLARNGELWVIRFNGAGVGDAARLRTWVNRVEKTATFNVTWPATVGAGAGLSLGRSFGGGNTCGMSFLRLLGFNAALTV